MKTIQIGTLRQVSFDKNDVFISQENKTVWLSKNEALAIAADIQEEFGKWIDASVKPAKSDFYHVKGCEKRICYYNSLRNTWFLQGGGITTPTHYQPIKQPRI